jgi:hypothetical protein
MLTQLLLVFVMLTKFKVALCCCLFSQQVGSEGIDTSRCLGIRTARNHCKFIFRRIKRILQIMLTMNNAGKWQVTPGSRCW